MLVLDVSGGERLLLVRSRWWLWWITTGDGDGDGDGDVNDGGGDVDDGDGGGDFAAGALVRSRRNSN